MKTGRLSNDEIDNIRFLLQQGESIRKISILTDRTEYSIRNVQKEMMLEEKKKEKDEEKKPDEDIIQGDMRTWLRQNWHWKIPERKSDPPVKKRSSHFRTPYHYLGRGLPF